MGFLRPEAAISAHFAGRRGCEGLVVFIVDMAANTIPADGSSHPVAGTILTTEGGGEPELPGIIDIGWNTTRSVVAVMTKRGTKITKVSVLRKSQYTTTFIAHAVEGHSIPCILCTD